MAYWVSSVVRGSTVGYPSDSLPSYFYFFCCFWCAIMPLTGVINYVCHFLLVVLWNRDSIYIGFWIYWALSILQYPSRKKDIIFFRGGPQPKIVTGGPGWLRYATEFLHAFTSRGFDRVSWAFLFHVCPPPNEHNSTCCEFLRGIFDTVLTCPKFRYRVP